VFVWRDDFSVQVAQMDTHHKKLVEIANSIMEMLRTESDRGSLLKAVDALADYARYHCSAEEALLQRYDYPDIQSHKQGHIQLIKQVSNYKDGILAGNMPREGDFKKFLGEWVIIHILHEDKKYGEFLNAKGIF